MPQQWFLMRAFRNFSPKWSFQSPLAIELELDNLTKDSLLWQPGMSWGVLRDAGVGKMSRLGFHLLQLRLLFISGSWCMDHPHWADQSEHIRKGNQDGHFRHGGYHCIFLRLTLYESYYAAILKHFCKKKKQFWMLVKMIITNIIVVSVTSAADVTLVQETVAVEDDVSTRLMICGKIWCTEPHCLFHTLLLGALDEGNKAQSWGWGLRMAITV